MKNGIIYPSRVDDKMIEEAAARAAAKIKLPDDYDGLKGPDAQISGRGSCVINTKVGMP